MQVIAGTRTFQIGEETAVSIGKFDGRHRGHQKLLGELLRLREQKGYRAAVFTFDMAPAGIVTGKPQALITTNGERRRSLEKTGIDYLVEYPFDREAAHMTAEDFVERVLVGQMHAKAIVAGTDCGFGYRRAGNADLLLKLAPRFGYEALIVEKEQDGHRDISSTYVREELERGHMEKVTELLGEPYSLHGTVIHGNHIGGPRLGFPTANILPPPEKLLPPFGVYVSLVRAESRVYGGVTNIGKKPTVEGDAPVGVETYILNLTGDHDLYGKQIEVQLLDFERPEHKYSSMEELAERIEQDKKYAADYLKKHIG